MLLIVWITPHWGNWYGEHRWRNCLDIHRISAYFCYVFWEPVLYFDPVATCFKTTFLPGRFTGIAWDHGDVFTYRIWSLPEGDWTRGCELTWNVVKPRQGVQRAKRANSTIIWSAYTLFFLGKKAEPWHTEGDISRICWGSWWERRAGGTPKRRYQQQSIAGRPSGRRWRSWKW